MTQRAKFNMEDYIVTITGKNLQISDTIRDYVVEKLVKLDRFATHILEVNVTLDKQKLAHSVVVLIKYYHFKIKVQSNADDIYSAIDIATAKLYKLIRKYKTRLQAHRLCHLSEVDMNVNILSSEEEELEEINAQIDRENLKREEELFKMPDVVATDKLPLKTLRHDEAVMKLELSGDKFLIYRGEEDQRLRVIYRRDDEKLGIVEVE